MDTGQFGPYDGILPVLEKRQEMFVEVFGGSPLLPNPPPEGRAGILPVLRAAGARTVLPDMRGFGASGKPRETAAYADSAMARDVIALIAHLHLESVDVIGFSMGAGTAARLLILGAPQVKSAILGGIGDHAIEDTILEFPKNWPIPDYIPRPLTMKVWAEEGPKNSRPRRNCSWSLGVRQHYRRSSHGGRHEGAGRRDSRSRRPTLPVDALNKINVPVLILNGKADLAN